LIALIIYQVQIRALEKPKRKPIKSLLIRADIIVTLLFFVEVFIKHIASNTPNINPIPVPAII